MTKSIDRSFHRCIGLIAIEGHHNAYASPLSKSTNITIFNVGFDVVVKKPLIIFLGNKFLCFVDFKVSGQWIIIVSIDQLDLNYFRNIKQVFLM